jgi:hypothetical protein
VSERKNATTQTVVAFSLRHSWAKHGRGWRVGWVVGPPEVMADVAKQQIDIGAGTLAGSPALNAGDPAQLGGADQRGVVRSGGVNIGAYQASASSFVLTAPATVTAGTAFDPLPSPSGQ